MIIFVFITAYLLLLIEAIIKVNSYTDITYGEGVYITLNSFFGNKFPSSHPKPVYIGNSHKILFSPKI